MLKALLLSCALALPMLALVQRANADAPHSAIKPLAFTEYDLPNGLHVILSENHSAPVVASYVLYHVGSKNERPDRTGFAHFFEHLMFEGSENIKRGTIDKLVSGAGGNLNASTGFDKTDYFLNLPSNQLKLALWIESERMMHNRIDETGVETQRKVVKEERSMRYDNQPYGSLFEKLVGFALAGTPYAWTPIGSVQYIDQAKIDEFRDFWKMYYVPNNATLAIAGDISIPETKKLVEEYFGPIPRGAEPPRPKLTLTESPGPHLLVVKEDKTPLNATLQAWHACSERDPDSYPLDLLSNILAGGRSSRLYRRLVDKEQVALNVEAFPELFELTGIVGVFATGIAGVPLEKLDALIGEEVAKVRADGVTGEEFQKAMNQKEAEIANENGTMLARAKNLANAHVFEGGTDEVNKQLGHYLAVKREDLQRVAKKYLQPDKVYVLHYPAAEQGKASGDK
ncbi:MAG: pitrilysin family protein [Chthoniobacteraceae bacterium]